MTVADDLWAELSGEDWDESEGWDAGEIVGDSDRREGTL